MSVTAAQIAEAVKVALNAGTFSQSFTAQRLYLPMKGLKDLASLKVLVAAKTDDWAGPISRGGRQNDMSVDVGVFKRLAAGTDATAESANTTIDALVAFVKELAASFHPGQLGSLGVVWVRTTTAPLYDQQRLEQDNLFASLITVTYREFDSL